MTKSGLYLGISNISGVLRGSTFLEEYNEDTKSLQLDLSFCDPVCLVCS